MLQVNELDDVRSVLKSYSDFGYADQTDMNSALAFVATQIELDFKRIIGIPHYEYVKGLAGVYGIILEYSFLYWAEVYAIASEFVRYSVSKNLEDGDGFDISIPGYSESKNGSAWYDKDKMTLQNKYIENMYSAGYKVSSVRI